jgi:hypothetical protein
MESVPFFIVGLYGLVFLISGLIIVWLIVKRIRDKKGERFEDRSN